LWNKRDVKRREDPFSISDSAMSEDDVCGGDGQTSTWILITSLEGLTDSRPETTSNLTVRFLATPAK
jgi:hypothetical protein